MTNFKKFINHKFTHFDENQYFIDAVSNENDGQFFIDDNDSGEGYLTISYDNDIIIVRDQNDQKILDEFEFNDNWEKRVFDVYQKLT
jgi:hypothetical protein